MCTLLTKIQMGEGNKFLDMLDNSHRMVLSFFRFFFFIYVMHVQADGSKTKVKIRVGASSSESVMSPKKGFSKDGPGFNTSMAALLETEADQGRSTPGPHTNVNSTNNSQTPIPQKDTSKGNVCIFCYLLNIDPSNAKLILY